MIRFAATYEETLAIIAIVQRAAQLGLPIDSQLCMDLDACHSNGCPLDFDALLKAKDGDFSHDVSGIYRHLNRETGKLEDCFWPRFAKPETAKPMANLTEARKRSREVCKTQFAKLLATLEMMHAYEVADCGDFASNEVDNLRYAIRKVDQAREAILET